MDRSISPPPLRKQKHRLELGTQPAATGTTARAGTLRVFAWNVNGIAPFVVSYLQLRPQQKQRSIDAFFRANPQSVVTGRKRKRRGTEKGYGSSDSEGDFRGDGQYSGGEDDRAPSLRRLLKRHAWPHVLFLQEVKMKHGDARTMDAVRVAVNDASAVSTISWESGYPAASWKRPRQIWTAEQGMRREEKSETLPDEGPIYEVHFNLPYDAHNAKGFGGRLYGVAAVVRKDFRPYINTIRDVDWDREGRVQIIETSNLSFPISTVGSGSSQPSMSHFRLPTSDVAPQTQSNINCKPVYLANEKENEAELKLAFINIYAVNGTSNVYRSTKTGSIVGTRHDRKLAVHYELLREAKRLEDRGFSVVIAGDLNVARDTRDGYPNLRTWPRQHVMNRADFNEKFFSGHTTSLDPLAKRTLYAWSEHRLGKEEGAQRRADGGAEKLMGFDGIDTFRSVHGDERRYSYYPRGRDWGTSCDRVDLIIASKALGALLVDAGICDNPRDRGPSDHCPIWAEFGRLR